MPSQLLLDKSFVYKTLNISFLCLFFMQFFAAGKVFLNFNIIYKSYKYYSVTFIGEILLTHQAGERSCCFSVYYIQPFQHNGTTINTSTDLLFQSRAFTCYHTVSHGSILLSHFTCCHY